MAADFKIHENAQLRLGDQELESAGAASRADFGRVVHHDGPAVSIGEVPEGTSRARGRTPSTPRQLDSLGKHGLDAFGCAGRAPSARPRRIESTMAPPGPATRG